MRLEVLLPFETFMDEAEVSRIVAETPHGSFGLLPYRLDCVTALAPGLLLYETAAQGEACIAIDEGVLVKVGAWVRVSVRRAFRGSAGRTDLAGLRDAVTRQFLVEDEQARTLRLAMIKVESGFLHRLADLGSS
jgi:F-type H+-transporting ATPase subunit epsilon